VIPGSASPFFLGSSLAAASAGGLQIERSLRFNSSDSAYLSRTPASAGNRKTWTWAGWVKRSNLTDQQAFWSAGSTGTNRTSVLFDGSAKLRFFNYAGSVDVDLVTTPVYRDASAWYHFVIAVDTTQGTASNRIKLYVNGVEVTAFSTSTYPSSSQDLVFNSAIAHGIGRGEQSSGEYFSGYLTNIHFIDGQALTPSSFTETDATTGQLIPKTYTGSYGTNGFNLLFADNSSNTASTLGKDSSGLGNNWTPNNLSVTAGAGNDCLFDFPVNDGTDTGVGGEVKGNYATWNPLQTPSLITLSNGNLDAQLGVSDAVQMSTIGMSSGKWYAEITPVSTLTLAFAAIGIAKEGATGYLGSTSTGWGYHQDGRKINNGSATSYGAAYGLNDVIGVAFDADNGTLVFYKNGSSQGTAYTGLTSGPYFFAIGSSNTLNVLNAGQRAFAYTAPAGFKALCTQNLPAPLVTKSNTAFDVALWTGNGVSPRSITGLAFSPDLVWIKNRANGGAWNVLFDVIRGGGQLTSNGTDAELVAGSNIAGYVSAYTSDGFTLTAGSSSINTVNENSSGIVGWAWDAGTSTVSNTQGSITSQVRANPTAGFSVVTYTGSSTNNTVGHGLGVTPALVIVKPRTTSDFWVVYHSAFNDLSKYLVLNSTAAVGTSSNYWGTSGNWSSTTFGVYSGGGGNNNLTGVPTVAYCFSPVVGYSNGFSYTGNGSTDGVFVYLGMRPKLLLIKRTDTTGNWYLWDTVRNTYNVVGEELYPNLSSAAATATDLDILSNGFKMRSTAADFNASGGTYVGFAWAESPFNYSRAR